MNKELLEQGSNMEDGPEKNSYQSYVDLGGIINQGDYNIAMEKAKNDSLLDTQDLSPEVEIELKGLINLAKSYIDIAELNPINSDMLIRLFVVLRKDKRKAGVKNYHDDMSDQQILVEALRMLGDSESVEKMIKRHPQMNFNYKSE